MEKLPPPVKRYLTGKNPSHSSTSKLHENFVNIHENALRFVLHKNGLVDDNYKPTKQAVQEGYIDVCDRKALWKIDNVLIFLQGSGMKTKRQIVNQEIEMPLSGEPQWVNLGTIGTYFNVSANEIGKWLDKLDLRGDDKLGSNEAVDKGLVSVKEMSAGPGKKTRKIAMWNLHLVVDILKENGYELDFDYEKTLQGTGKNSNVEVSSLDTKIKEFTKEFVQLYKKPDTRSKAIILAKKQPKPFLVKSENLLKKPGFFTEGKYLRTRK